MEYGLPYVIAGARNCTKSPRSSGFLIAENLFCTLRSSLTGRCDLQWTQSCLKRLRIMTPWDKAQGCQILTNRQVPQLCRAQIPAMATCESVQWGRVLDTPSSRVVSSLPEASRTLKDSAPTTAHAHWLCL